MARPRSEEKRLALLEAAAQVLAEHGLAAAPTSLIAKRAGVAEGTLFRYFATKDVLYNELYLHLKTDMCAMLSKRYDSSKRFEERFQTLWESYIDWGLANPVGNRAINQLGASAVITSETTEKAYALFPETGIDVALANNDVFAGRTDFANTIFTAVADATMESAAKQPQEADSYKKMGFAALRKMYGLA